MFNTISAITAGTIAEIKCHGIDGSSIPLVGTMLAKVLITTTNATIDEAAPNLLAPTVLEAVTKSSEETSGVATVATTEANRGSNMKLNISPF